MSRVISPLAISNGLNNLLGTGAQSDLSIVRSVIIANISPYALYITGVDTERYLNPMEVDRFTCANGLAFLNGQATAIFVTSGFPANSCLVTLIYDGDDDPGGTYPFSLGAGSVQLTAPYQIIQDGYASGTTVIEVTPAGAAQSYIILKNDGTFQIWSISTGVLTEMLAIAPGSGVGPAQLTMGGGLDVTAGGAQVAGNSQVTGQLNVSAGLNVTGSGAQITGNSQITGQLIVTDVSQFQKILSCALGVAFTVGQITRVSHFSGVGPGAVAHGLGTTPDVVLVMPNSSSVQSWAVNSIGGTNCTIAIGAGIAWTAVALKF